MLIALNGPPGAGKTTTAEILCRQGARRLDLTRPFKSFINEMMGVTEVDAVTHKDDLSYFPSGVTLRDLQIEIATCLEKADPVVWIKHAVKNYDSRRIYVLDSVGKIAQWRWLVDQLGDELVLCRVSDGDQAKFKGDSGIDFIDGREAIWPQPGQLHVPIGNAHPDQRSSLSLDALHSHVLRAFANILNGT